MKRIAKFHKVSKERFTADWIDTFAQSQEEAEKVYEAKRQKNDSFHPGSGTVRLYYVRYEQSESDRLQCNAGTLGWRSVCRCDDDFKFCA